jgi:hypothetical protein
MVDVVMLAGRAWCHVGACSVGLLVGLVFIHEGREGGGAKVVFINETWGEGGREGGQGACCTWGPALEEGRREQADG